MSANEEAHMEKKLLNVRELSEYLSMPTATVYAYVGRGKIPANCIRRIGRSLKFDRAAVDGWINGPSAEPANAQAHG